MSIAIPKIPDSAPFSESQRNWLNGYIAALQGSTSGFPVPADTQKERVVVMYASQSGNSEALAEEFGSRLTESGFQAPVICAEDYQSIDLTKEKTLLMISSTWGEGDPPDNAVDFWGYLTTDEAPKLENLRFSVLGLGDSNYIDFCGMGKALDKRFEELGGSRLAPRGDCDTDYEETAAAWFDAALSVLGTSSPKNETKAIQAPVGFSKKNPFPAKLKANLKLNEASSNRDTRHFEICLSGSGLTYEVGDVLAVCPENDPALVEEILHLLKLEANEEQWSALINDCDICAVSAKLFESWKSYCSGGINLSEENVNTYISEKQLVDLATDFPATFESVDVFISLLRKLGPRLYSISSSPKAHPDEVHLTVARVEYETFGRTRKGVCSTYLADRLNESDSLKVYLQHVKHFKLPADTTVPVIMVGPGTGVAPFRAFLEERAATGSEGPNWLFFGNPHEKTDWLYKDQFRQMERNGVLTHYHRAWSRDGEEKVYVQDHIRQNGAELWEWIGNQGAHFYVCGDAKRMAKDVDSALQELIANFGGMNDEQAAEYIAKMKKDKRYQRDVY